jgi:hypothetical protein
VCVATWLCLGRSERLERASSKHLKADGPSRINAKTSSPGEAETCCAIMQPRLRLLGRSGDGLLFVEFHCPMGAPVRPPPCHVPASADQLWMAVLDQNMACLVCSSIHFGYEACDSRKGAESSPSLVGFSQGERPQGSRDGPVRSTLPSVCMPHRRDPRRTSNKRDHAFRLPFLSHCQSICLVGENRHHGARGLT